MTDEDIQIIRKFPLFESLEDDQLDCIRLGQIGEAEVGKVFAKDGEVGDYNFYLLISGEVRLWRSYDRQDVLMAVGKPGSFMGEIAILLDTPWLATARVSKPSRFFW